MLSPRLTNCPECANIPSLLKKIDCKLAELGNNLYNNISYMLNKPVPSSDILQLIGYRRILMHKYCNPNYVEKYSVQMIASRVIRLTAGCVSKCNELERCLEEPCDIKIVPNPTTTSTSTLPPSTTTTSTSSTSSTTTTSTTAVPTTTTTSSSSTSTTTSTSSSTSTTTSTTTVVSTEWIIFASFNPYSACQQIDGENVTVYTSTSFLGNGVTLYLDAGLTIPYVSNPSTSNVLSDGTNQYFLGDTGGAVIVFSGSCAPFVPTTTTTSSSSSTSTTTSSTSSTTTTTTTSGLTTTTTTFVPGPCSLDPCVDHDVTIGTQVWTGCNLNVSTYRNGDLIPEVTDPTAWANLTTGAWCYLNNDPATGPIYGKLYNWYAVNDPRGLAPTGYHVPTIDEWFTLRDYLGGPSVAGGILKENGLCHWASPNTGATNAYGFTMIPNGTRNSVNGGFNTSVIWQSSHWAASLQAPEFAYVVGMYYSDDNFYSNNGSVKGGLAVRLVKGPELTTTTTSSSSTSTTTSTSSSSTTTTTTTVEPTTTTTTSSSSTTTTTTTAGPVSSILGPTGIRPYGITIDSLDNIYTGNAISNDVTKITPAGVSTILGTTGSFPLGITIDASDNIYTANQGSNNVTKITPAGVSSVFGPTGTSPVGITIDSSGNIYTVNQGSNDITKITPSGVSSIFATTGSGAGPNEIVIDSSENIYTISGVNPSPTPRYITKVTPSGVTSSILVSNFSEGGMAIDSSGNIYIGDQSNLRIVKVTQAGVESIFGTAGSAPIGLVFDSVGNLYVSNLGSNNVTKITPLGVSTILGTTQNEPYGITIDPAGNIYTANSFSNNVTKITV